MLTVLAVKAAKSKEKSYKLPDERGLHLLVTPTGGRLWRFRYYLAGRERMISLGQFPDVSLEQARDRRDAARKLVADGIDPSAKRKAEKAARADTFAAVAQEWLAGKRKALAAGTWQRDHDQAEKLLGPDLGKRPIASIEAPELLAVLRKIEARGRRDTAHRCRALFGRVARFAIATGRATRDVSADLRGALAPKASKSYAAVVEPAKVGALLRAIWDYDGQPATAAALKLAPYLFVRPGELRGAEWSEIDLDKAEWRIPEERMKRRELHIVPLATQAVALLRELEAHTGGPGRRFCFPAIGAGARPISENTLGAALRRIGYASSEMTAHGFRSIASTLLNEQGFHPDLIELQLAHAERNKVRAAYNRAQRLAERRKMMQSWADFLDGLRLGAKVTPIASARR